MFEILPPPLISFLFGGIPISEVRGSAIYSFSVNDPFLMVFGIVGNIVASLGLLLLWNILKIDRIGKRIVGKRLGKMIERFHKNHELGETIGLVVFIGIPFPLTGVYSGVLVGKILKVSDKKIICACIFGVLVASCIMFFALSGFVSLFSFLT
ncbi:MAG: small multi-drug export protein [Euryarchaeota archaeon]|nr:small multi-drug export protein [Euryarchaeota archaeon]